MLDLVVRNGHLVVPHHGVIRADVGIANGKIVRVGSSIVEAARDELDASGQHIFPGLVDPHVHFGQYFPFKMDLAAESRSAAHGGVTTLLTTLPVGSPTNTPTRPYLEFLSEYIDDLDGISWVDYGLRLTFSSEASIEDVAQSLDEFGISSVKFFTAYKDRPVNPGISYDVILRFLRRLKSVSTKALPLVHAESDEVVRVATEDVRRAGLNGLRAWNAARPNFAEALAIRDICEIARYLGAEIYIVHVSTAEGAAVIAEEQQLGTRVIGETCVHYLSLTTDLEGVVAKVSPPVREKSDVDALWSAIQSRTITCVGSDHVARPTETKQGDIWQASMAFPGLETILPVMVTKCLERSLPLSLVAEVCSWNNARTFGLRRKGNIAVGYDADLVLADINSAKTIHADELHSQAKHTPYEGMTAVGWPVATVLGGQIVMRDRQLVGRASGKYQRLEGPRDA